MKKSFSFFGVSSALLLMASCSSDDLGSTPSLKGRIAFGVEVEQMAEAPATRSAAPAITTFTPEEGTPVFLQASSVPYIREPDSCHTATVRGTAVTSSNIHDTFGLYVFDYPSSQRFSDITSTTAPTLANHQVNKGDLWYSSKHWPGKERNVSFFSYAPFNCTGISLSAATTKGYPYFTFTVNRAVADHTDLLVSQNDTSLIDIPGDSYETVNMKLRHALTAIRFKIGEKMASCVIKSISIKNFYQRGTYSFETQEWTNQYYKASDMTIDPYYEVTEEKNVEFTGMNNDMYFMIPQTLPSGATITITFDTNNTAVSKAFNIGGTEWKAGHTVTYSISTEKEGDEYFLSVAEPKDIAGTGGTYSWDVTSYRQSAFGTQSPISWETYFTLNDDTVKHYDVDRFVTAFTKQLATTKLTTTFSTTFGKNYAHSTMDNTHTALLADTPEKGTKEKPYNLANASGGEAVENTANCYVVNAPGHYSIPVVYGNTIKNGTANTDVFGEDKTRYINHMGNVITSPYLVDNTSVVPDNVSIVWQDAYHLIDMDSLKLSDDKKTISFSISKDNICQGNAIIAVRDSKNVIMWSWHIWVTDFGLTTTAMVNHSNVTYDFMDLPLGFCDPDERTSPIQKVVFHFKQIDGEAEATLPLNIGQLNESLPFNATYYQHGRKDPMLGAVNNKMKSIYDSPYSFTINNPSEAGWNVSYTDLIKYPSTFYSLRGTDNSSYFITEPDYWDVGCDVKTVYDGDPSVEGGRKVVKSLYDPSPVGFCVPAPAAFSGFTLSGGSETDVSQFNIANPAFNQGWTFKSCVGDNTMFWHALGILYRRYDEYGTSGYYWSSAVSSTADRGYTRLGYHLYFNANMTNPAFESLNQEGYPVRPVKE